MATTPVGPAWLLRRVSPAEPRRREIRTHRTAAKRTTMAATINPMPIPRIRRGVASVAGADAAGVTAGGTARGGAVTAGGGSP